jgi:hypothetical protein
VPPDKRNPEARVGQQRLIITANAVWFGLIQVGRMRTIQLSHPDQVGGVTKWRPLLSFLAGTSLSSTQFTILILCGEQSTAALENNS